ncbi:MULTISPECIES: FixH family protein [Mesorhizobium]|uniref:Cytochrome oxidase n=1 Tax=Mesorhizobium denitrificans TaxID=2294114 RepID=A0A371XGB4_9HYPH|nr:MULTISPECIES: FixH family protein [Mesorhizobium]RFC68277.1 cytochrome oxidase [Mesorhizobium denitrificans]
MSTNGQSAGFTGRHMLLIMLAFFGVIIAVNFLMAYFARSSWTGLVVENSYVASQEFNAKMAETRAQEALGWTGNLVVADGRVRYSLTDKGGHAVRLKSVGITFMHPVDDREDEHIDLVRGGDGIFDGPHTFSDGVWLVEIVADAGLEKPYRETLRVHVEQGKRT